MEIQQGHFNECPHCSHVHSIRVKEMVTQNSLEQKWVMEQISEFEFSALMAMICELQQPYIWELIFF